MGQSNDYGSELLPVHGDSQQQSPCFHPQQQSPIHENPVFAFPGAQQPYDPSFHPQSRPSHHPLQPLNTSAWTSAFASHDPHHLMQTPMMSGRSILPLPTTPAAHLPPGRHGVSAKTSRRLTNADRRSMCLYHEAHPTKKQTEIAELFGVERSTISKVLRDKEKYLDPNDDGSQSPVKKAKKRPDIERALANWAKKQQSKGTYLTDEQLRDQAKWWCCFVSENKGDLPNKINSPGWSEEFRQKHKLHRSESRK